MLKNLLLKFLAILGALIFWIATVSLEHNIKELPDLVPIQAFNLSEDLAIKHSLGSIRLKISSEKQDVAKISKDNFQAFVDLKDLKKGEHTVDVQVTSQNKDYTIAQVDPKTISIIIEKKVSREVPVQVLIKGDPMEGYKIGKPIASEDNAKIFGISETIHTISQVSAVVNLEGTEIEDIESMITLAVLDEEGKPMDHVRVEPQEIAIIVPINQSDYVRTVGIKPVFHGQLPDPTVWLSKINLNPVDIQIAGKKDVIDAVEYIETESIDRSEIKNGQVRNNFVKRVQLVFPQGVKPADEDDTTALVELTVSPIESDDSPDEDIEDDED